MPDIEEFREDDFEMISEDEGQLSVTVMGMEQKIDYTARNYIKRGGTVGYCDMEADDKSAFIFLSKTENGKVVTLPGPQSGPVDMEFEGIYKIWGVNEEEPVEVAYEEHQKALEGEPLKADEAWLRENVPGLPDLSADIMVGMVNAMFEAFGGPEGMVDALGDVMKETMEGMAEAMGEGMEKAMGEGMEKAFQGMGGAMEEVSAETVEIPPEDEGEGEIPGDDDSEE